MAHELMNGSAYAGRRAAWHNLGTVVPDAETMTELAIAAGLEFEYVKTPVFFEVETLDSLYHHQYVGRSVLTRDGLAPLAIVSDDYEFHQPMEMAESMDRIIKAGGWKPETALALGKGETTVFCVALGDFTVGGTDQVKEFLLLTDTVDGKHSKQLCIVDLRVVCANTLRIGLKTAMVKVNLDHVAGHRLAYAKAVDAIVASQSRVREALTALSKVKFTEERLKSYYETVFAKPGDDVEDSAQKTAVVKRMSELQDSATGFARRMVKDEGLELTGWVAYNGASEAVEHGRIMPNLSMRKSLVMGTGVAAATLERAYVLAGRA